MNILQEMESDFKAEMIAAQFLAQEQDVGKLIIDRLGSIPRSHTKDVYHTYEDISQLNLDKFTVLQSFRQSIYEAIPENTFHPPTLGGLGKTNEEILEQIKIQRRKEQEARTFFKPFEQEGPYLEMQALMMELMYEKKGSYDNLYKLFQQGWNVVSKLPKHIALGFIYILPMLNQVRGKREWAERCLSFLTEQPVTITESYSTLPIEKKKKSFNTSDAVLGINTTFAGAQNDGFPTWVIKVGPVKTESAPSVLPQSGFDELLDILLEYLAPINVLIEKKITIATEQPTYLSADRTAGRLGYTFTI